MGVVYARDSSAARARARRATHARFAEFGVYIGAMTQFGLSSAGMLENELCPARNTSAVDQWAMKFAVKHGRGAAPARGAPRPPAAVERRERGDHWFGRAPPTLLVRPTPLVAA